MGSLGVVELGWTGLGRRSGSWAAVGWELTELAGSLVAGEPAPMGWARRLGSLVAEERAWRGVAGSSVVVEQESMGLGRRLGTMAVAARTGMVGTGTLPLAFRIRSPLQRRGWLPRRWPPTARTSSSLVVAVSLLAKCTR